MTTPAPENDDDVIRLRFQEVRSRSTPPHSHLVRLLLPQSATDVDILAVAERAALEHTTDRIIVALEPGEPAPMFAVWNDGGVWRWGTDEQVAAGHGTPVVTEGREDGRTDGESLAIDATWVAWVNAGCPGEGFTA